MIKVVNSIAAAREAGARGDWSEALALWQAASGFEDASPFVALGWACSLLALGRADEADVVLATAIAAHPKDVALARARARAAERRGDGVEAAARWRNVLRLIPTDAQAHVDLAACERARGALNASDTTLRKATRVCSAPDLDVARAWTALALRKTPTAWAHWTVIRALYPEHRLVDLGPYREKADLRQLARRFVSLGGNCELGLVQRHVGVETLDLLRWSSVFPTSLAAACRVGFMAIDDPATLQLEVDHSGEYMLRDARYGIAIHCFAKPGENDEEEFHQRQISRIRLLREKLLHDLESAYRIAVYWQPSLSVEDIDTLHAAFNKTFPSATLLCVHVGDDSVTTPAVQLRRPGLLVGAIDRDGRVGTRQGWSIAVDQWLAVMLDARRIVEEIVKKKAS